jgi:hypothetical protein
MKRLSVLLDPNGWPVPNAIVTSDYIDVAVLTGGAAKAVTVPTGAKYCRLKCANIFYVNLVTTAVVPTLDVTDGTGILVSPEIIFVFGVTTISLISASSGPVTLEFYT